MKGELSLKKRCIWNWDHGKKIEYLEERGKKAKFETIFGIGIASVAGIFFGVLPLIVIFYYIFEIVMQGPSVIQEQIINIVLIIILVFPFLGIWICLKEEQCLLIREKERKLVNAIYFLFAKKVVLKKKKRKKTRNNFLYNASETNYAYRVFKRT